MAVSYCPLPSPSDRQHTPCQRISCCLWADGVQPRHKVAPYDALIADEALSEERLRTALGAAAMWTTSHAVPLLPYSCVVLESVPEAEARARMPPPWHTSASPPLAQVLPFTLCLRLKSSEA